MKYICPEMPSCKIFSYSLIVCLLSSYLLLQRFNKVIQKLTRGWGNQALAYASVGFYEIMGLFIIMHYWTIANLIKGTFHGCGNSWNGWTSFVLEFWVLFTGPRCLWGPVYGSRCTYILDFVKLCWCDSGWWWYQLNTIDDANLKRSLAICNQCHICKSH